MKQLMEEYLRVGSETKDAIKEFAIPVSTWPQQLLKHKEMYKGTEGLLMKLKCFFPCTYHFHGKYLFWSESEGPISYWDINVSKLCLFIAAITGINHILENTLPLMLMLLILFM